MPGSTLSRQAETSGKYFSSRKPAKDRQPDQQYARRPLLRQKNGPPICSGIRPSARGQAGRRGERAGRSRLCDGLVGRRMHGAGCGRCDLFSNVELAHERCKFRGFAGQGLRRRRRLLNHGGVLLRNLVHLVHCRIDLREAGRLFLRGRRDFRDKLFTRPIWARIRMSESPA